MRRIATLFAILALMLCLSACSAAQPGAVGEVPSQGPDWQEQYDLGVRYLSEGNYQEAILAFTAAIEVDPKRAPAYVGRGDAYVLSGEAEVNLTAAKADYEKAIELDIKNSDIYLKLTDTYIAQSNYVDAIKVLRKAIQICPTDEIAYRLTAITSDASSETDNHSIHIADPYSSQAILKSAEVTIGGRSFADMSYDEIVVYYGAEAEKYSYDSGLQWAGTEQGPFGADPHVCIQFHADNYEGIEVLFIHYSSRHGAGVASEVNQPEFLGLKIGDSLDDAMLKIGIKDDVLSSLRTNGIRYFGMQILADIDQGIPVLVHDFDRTIIEIFWHERNDKHLEMVTLSFDANDILTDFSVQRQIKVE